MNKPRNIFGRLFDRVKQLFTGEPPAEPPAPKPPAGKPPVQPPKPPPPPPPSYEPEEEDNEPEPEQYKDPFTDEWVTPPRKRVAQFERAEQRSHGYQTLYGAFNYAMDIPVTWIIIQDPRTDLYHVVVIYERLAARKYRPDKRTWRSRRRKDNRKNRKRNRSKKDKQ